MIGNQTVRAVFLPIFRRGASGATVPVALISQLRRDTGASIQRCKEALEKSDKDVQAAIEFLRKKGETIKATQLNSASSHSRRIAVSVAPCATRGVLTVTTAQTDFASESELFVRFSEAFNTALMRSTRAEIDPAMQLGVFSSQVHGSKLGDILSEISVILSEPVVTEASKVVSGDLVSVYLHNRSQYSQSVGQQASMVALRLHDVAHASREKLAHFSARLARQVLATCPEYISYSDVPESVLEKERSIIQSKVMDPKMVDKAFKGHMKRFASEKCLLDMEWIIPSDGTLAENRTVREALADECKALGLPEDSVNISHFVVQK